MLLSRARTAFKPTIAALALWTLASALSACGGTHSMVVERRIDGQVRAGIVISPYTYEHFLRGELAAAHGQHELALSEYQQARLGPQDDPLLIARVGQMLDLLGRSDSALALLTEAVEQTPEAEALWLALAEHHRKAENMESAIDALSRAIEVAPTSDRGPLALADLLANSEGERPQPERAQAVLERFLARAGGARAARASLRLALLRGQPRAAAQAVDALLRVAPARADEVREAAVTALRSGRPVLASRLLAALPEVAEDRPLRLEAALCADDLDGARSVLASWMPRGHEELLRVAEGYLALGDAARAVELIGVARTARDSDAARLAEARARRALGQSILAASLLLESASAPDALPLSAELAADAGLPALAAEIRAAGIRAAEIQAPEIQASDNRVDGFDRTERRSAGHCREIESRR